MQDLFFSQSGKDEKYKIWHTPEKNIFIFVESGEGSIVSREKSYPIASGTLCFVGAEKYHYTFPKEPSEYVRSKLLIDSNSLESILRLLVRDADFPSVFGENSIFVSSLSSTDARRVAALFEHLKRMGDSPRYLSGEIRVAAMQLMLVLAENGTANEPVSRDPLQTAIRYVNRHACDDLSLDAIAEACYVSKYHLCRAFKKRMGVTIMEYILHTRLVLAKEYLRREGMSVTEISSACGFTSPAHFSRVFKEQNGLSPLQYRKQHVVKNA